MFKILIIEDNDDNRDILKHQLEYLGYEVVEAVDGLKVLTRWQRNSRTLSS